MNIVDTGLRQSQAISGSSKTLTYMLQQLFKEELEHIQKQQIIIALEIDETLEWHNSFILVPKLSGKVQLCLDPVRPNEALFRPVHSIPM